MQPPPPSTSRTSQFSSVQSLTLKSLLQHKSSKSSILWRSAFFMVQISLPYMTTRKNTALTIQTFVIKVMSLLFNMLSKLVIALLPRSKRLLISWLQSSSVVILQPKKIKPVTVSIVSPSICHELMGRGAMISSVQFSHSVVSDSLPPHGLQHARPPCSSPTPRVYSNSCPLSQLCHPTISSSVVPFSCLQSFSASGSFPMSQLFASGGQSTGVSASGSALPVNIQD